MARIVMVHGAYCELWGPHQLRARLLPALRDGLWHHNVEIDDADVAMCFYGDLFRHTPGSQRDAELEHSRGVIADALSGVTGGDALAALHQSANTAAFERTIDLVNVIINDPDLRSEVQGASSRSLTMRPRS